MSKTNSRPRKMRRRGLSIQESITLVICVILLLMMLGFALVSYYSVRRLSLKVSNDRLETVSNQLSNLFGQSAVSLTSNQNATVNTPAMRNFLNSKGEENYSEASQVLQTIRKDSNTLLVQIIYPTREPLLRSEGNIGNRKPFFDSIATVLPLTPGVGKLYEYKNDILYPVITTIGTDNVIGYLVRWRIQGTSANSIEQFNTLLGEGARFFVANVDGSVWTDLRAPVTHPPADSLRFIEPTFYTNNDNTEVIGLSRKIPATPWQITIEFEAAVKLQPAKDYLRWVVIVGSGLLLMGILLAWFLSRNITKPLNKLTGAAAGIANGKFAKVEDEVNRTDEVGKLARAFNAMSEQVSKGKKVLENKIEESEKMTEQLRELSAHLQNIRENERIHIAREMHDELGQLLTGFKMDVSWLNKKLANNEDPSLREKLSEMTMIVDEAVKFVRKLAAELRPGILDDLGLVPALDWHSKEFEKRYGISVDFKSSADEVKISSQAATGLYRIYQESLTNVARHSNAKKVIANLEADDKEIRLSIKDDGSGFDTTKKTGTLGLLGMKERASMIGGVLEIISSPGKGTQVLIKVSAE